jgi:spermidine synthase
MMSRLAVAFFATGFAALLCQIVWQRMLGIFAGSDTISAALVVGAFLAGLGLGSIIGAKVADRLSPARALAGFALAEVGVGVFACCPSPSCTTGSPPTWPAWSMRRRRSSRSASPGWCCRPR